MADQDADQKPIYDAELPDDEALDEEPEESDESGEAEGDEFEGEAAAAAASGAGSRRFGFGRGSRVDEALERERDKRQGSVREAHERVKIDDRPSAVYALICAGALLGVLAAAWLGGVLPQPTGPTLTPLTVPTAQATPVTSPSASASVVVSPSASTSPVASPSK